ncbi:S-adenosyl-L-methionine-dependent methyltransferase [Dactylonectria macrodidyma]|uniref:S-adenosyl-L-methionine-dependent methyltransferase n=1 Tax=Dactylonectria macrodidyma TaxID=307937 RepID=A0A9P9EN58_9HYPO|nr:S-adenosyl-L-methionine-dependent methyltransferase [Dactylonectria macrodidyma]
MLEYFLRSVSDDSLFALPVEKPGKEDPTIGLHSGSSDGEESDDDLELIDNNKSWNVGQHAAQALGHVDLAGLTQWTSVTPSDTINFVVQAQKDPTQNSSWRIHLSRPISADFALISGIDDWEYDNYYLNPLAQEPQQDISLGGKKWVSSYNDDISVKAGDVLILIGQESQHIVASLQTTKISLIISGATLWTRKLSLKAPLSRGTSGSWVVDSISGALCGSIIAVFDEEPFALMVTAQTLFSDISNYSSLATEQATPPIVAQPLGQSVQATTASEAQDGYTDTSEDDADDQIKSIDAGSSLSDYTGSSTTSMGSSIFGDQVVVNGRTYQDANGRYWAPIDEAASEALDLLHYMSVLILDGKLYLAPLEKNQVHNVLDIGTGTGMWAMDFADEFPEAEVIGIDISPIQPTWVPPNLRFEIDDFTLDWTFHNDSADFIHMRFLRGSVSDWHSLYKNAFRTTKPGGWIETHEDNPVFYNHDGPIEDGSAIAEWGKLFLNGSEKLGRIFTPIPDNLQEEGLVSAGFVDIKSQTYKVPIGRWPEEERVKKIGMLAKMNISADVQGHIGFMAHLCGWTSEEITIYCTRLRDELRSLTAHAFYYQRIVWGRKPGKDEASV